jgi:mycothiol system anti-sigma-R factor
VSCGEPHETDCREVLEAVYVYLDAECDDDKRDKVRHHLDECSPCLRQFGIEQEIKVLVARRCGGDVAPEALRARLKVKLREVVVEADAREFQAE